MLPPDWPITSAISASVPGRFGAVTLMSAGKRCGLSGSTSHATSIHRSCSNSLRRGEWIWNQWEVPTLSRNLEAMSGFVEGSYKIWPGLFVASRIDRLGFGRLPIAANARPTWDAPVTRLETGVGYYIRRNFLAKAAYQHNWRDGGLVKNLGLTAFQLHFWL